MATSHTDLAISQPGQVFPAEIMAQIFQDYAAFRLRKPLGVELDRTQAMSWKVFPILTSCKLFAALMLPGLYREVVLANEEALRGFFCEPSIDSFKLVHTMKITCTGASYSLIATSIQDRILQSQLLAFPRYNRELIERQRDTKDDEPFNGSSRRASNYREFWEANERHTLEMVHINSENIDVLNEIAKL